MGSGANHESRPSSNAQLLERMTDAARRESVRARASEWAEASPERHAEVLVQVLDMADAITRSRGFPVKKNPLPLIKMRGSRIPELRL